MAMDSYIKGMAGSQQAVPVRPVEGGQKASALERGVQNASMQESTAKKVSEMENTTKKTSEPKSSNRKASVPKSSKKASVPKSSTKKASVPKGGVKKASMPAKSNIKRASVSGGSVPKATKQIQRADRVSAADNVQRTAGTGEENMEVLFTMEKEPSISTIDSAISMMNAQMAKTNCSYSYDEDTKRITIKMYDDDTGELIREVPPEKSLEVLKKIWEMAGIMVDEKF